MHNTNGNNNLAAATPEAIYAEPSLLDAILEIGVRTPVAPSALDALVADAPVAGKYSRGRRIVVRNVEIVRQDSDVLSQGGLFGMVDEAVEPSRPVHGSQISLPMGAVETDKSSGCCVCGDPSCGIGPFIVTKSKGGR